MKPLERYNPCQEFLLIYKLIKTNFIKNQTEFSKIKDVDFFDIGYNEIKKNTNLHRKRIKTEFEFETHNKKLKQIFNFIIKYPYRINEVNFKILNHAQQSELVKKLLNKSIIFLYDPILQKLINQSKDLSNIKNDFLSRTNEKKQKLQIETFIDKNFLQILDIKEADYDLMNYLLQIPIFNKLINNLNIINVGISSYRKHQSLDFLRTVIKHGSKIDKNHFVFAITTCNSLEVIKFLCAHYNGSIIDQKYENGKTLLFYSVAKGLDTNQDFDCVQFLVNKKSDINHTLNNGDSILHEAANQSYKITDFLLNSKADINIKNHNNETPLMKAVQYANMKLVVKLLEYKADPHAINIHNENIINYASENNTLNAHLLFFRLTSIKDINCNLKSTKTLQTPYDVLKQISTNHDDNDIKSNAEDKLLFLDLICGVRF